LLVIVGSLLGFLAEQQVSHDDPFYVNNAVGGLTGIDTSLRDSPRRRIGWASTRAISAQNTRTPMIGREQQSHLAMILWNRGEEIAASYPHVTQSILLVGVGA